MLHESGCTQRFGNSLSNRRHVEDVLRMRIADTIMHHTVGMNILLDSIFFLIQLADVFPVRIGCLRACMEASHTLGITTQSKIQCRAQCTDSSCAA